MKTQIERAREGVVTPEMATVGTEEGIDPELVRDRVAAGRIVIPRHPNRPDQRTAGIGRGLRTKVNASVGASSDIRDPGAGSSQGPGRRGRRPDGAFGRRGAGRDSAGGAGRGVPAGGERAALSGVPRSARKYKNPNRLDPERLFDLIEAQLADGISFMAINAASTASAWNGSASRDSATAVWFPRAARSWSPGWNETTGKIRCTSSSTGSAA